MNKHLGFTALVLIGATWPLSAKPVGEHLKPQSTSVELTQLRTRHSKTFQNANGTRTWSASAGSVHFLDEQRTWQEIDLDILPQPHKPFAYGMTRNAYRSSFGVDVSAPVLARFEAAGWAVSFGLKHARKCPVKADGNVITYLKPLPDTDLRFTTLEDELREELVLHRRPTTTRWEFELSLEGVRVETSPGGSLDFVEISTGNRLWFMPSPFMLDAAGERSERVVKSLITTRNGNTLLVVEADPAWLQAPERAYPVVVDPTWTAPAVSADTYVCSGYPNTARSTETYMRTSGSTFSGENACRTLIKWDMTGAPAPEAVNDAAGSCSVSVKCTSATAPTAYDVGCHKVTSPWADNVTWNTKPAFEPTPFATISVRGNEVVYVWSWNGRNNSPDGNGVLLFLNDTWNGSKNWETKERYGGVRPSLSMTYTPVLTAPPAANPTGETTSRIVWNWTDINSSEGGYRVYDAATGGSKLSGDLAANTTSWTETGLTAGARYTRYVCAYSGATETARTLLPSAMASYPATWHNWDQSAQSRASADTYIASGAPSVNFAAAAELPAGYLTTDSPFNCRPMVQFDQSSLPAPSLRRGGVGRASLRMYCIFNVSANAYTVTAHRVTADWNENGLAPTWNSFNTSKEATPWTSASVSNNSVHYTWDWDPSAQGMPEPQRGLMFLPQGEGQNIENYAKSFASRNNPTFSAPQMRMDYYLPLNPGWITRLLVLGGVGNTSIDTQTYATAAGLTGDTDLFGNSTKTYGGKSWAARDGNVSEDGFNNYAWDLGPTGLNFGANLCALFNLYVHSSVAVDDCYLRCGSDDGVRLIVNDAVIGTDDVVRTWAREQSVFGPFHLNAGWNRVLLKVRNNVTAFGLKGLRFSNGDATPWTGSTLTYAIDDTALPSNPTTCTESGGAPDNLWQDSVSSPHFNWSGAADAAANNEGASGLRGYRVYFGTNSAGAPVGAIQSAANYSSGSVPAGTCYLRVTTLDKAMNESAPATLFTFRYDHAPVAQNITIGSEAGMPTNVLIIGGKHPPTDADPGDTMTVTAVGTPAHGSAVISGDARSITYTLTDLGFWGEDSFNYTVTDNHGFSGSPKLITVQIRPSGSGPNITGVIYDNSILRVGFHGIPGATYKLQYTAAVSPAQWTDVGTTATCTTGTNGSGMLLDEAATNASRFYRTIYVSGP